MAFGKSADSSPCKTKKAHTSSLSRKDPVSGDVCALCAAKKLLAQSSKLILTACSSGAGGCSGAGAGAGTAAGCHGTCCGNCAGYFQEVATRDLFHSIFLHVSGCRETAAFRFLRVKPVYSIHSVALSQPKNPYFHKSNICRTCCKFFVHIAQFLLFYVFLHGFFYLFKLIYQFFFSRRSHFASRQIPVYREPNNLLLQH